MTGPKRPKRGFFRICAECGREYLTSSDRSRFCGSACKQKAYRRRRDGVTVHGP